MRIIETGPLSLEPQTAGHAAEMFQVLCDPAIYEHENEPPASIEWLEDRFRRLESRSSADGTEQWLNWVVHFSGSELIGYVQATVNATGEAAIAYVLASAYWGRGLATQAVRAMMSELSGHYGVRRFTAVLKTSNLRSLRLLERLGFLMATPELHLKYRVDPDEVLMILDSTKGRPD